MIDPRIIDPAAELGGRVGLTDREVDEVVDLLAALREWHLAAERMSAASRAYMNLNANDMRAVRFLIAAENVGQAATASAVAQHLGISTAATTKLLDRLEEGGHVRRLPNPGDRRALILRVTPSTRRSAREGVGRQHARRFVVGASLSSDERAIVARFLRALAATEDDEVADPPGRG